jgi:uncharacterized protein YbjT (DUF2867 family)
VKLVISGATGQIGQHLIQNLDYRAHDYVLITRRASALAQVRDKGATIAEGDLKDATFLTSTLAGADGFFFLPPPNFASKDMIAEYSALATTARDAVKAAGVKRVVHLSTIGGHINDRHTGLIYGQHLAENIIAQAAEHVLHLRNGFFLENYFASMASISAGGAIYLPVAGSARYQFVATADIARLVAEVITDTKWSGRQVLEYHGHILSFDEVAAQLGAGLGKAIQHVGVPPEDAIDALQKMGLSAAYATDLTALLQAIDTGLLKAEFKSGTANVREGGMTPRQFSERFLAPNMPGC